ncbi:MAG: hypothetical protein ACRDD1_03230 [Planctomycetia bacterium]
MDLEKVKSIGRGALIAFVGAGLAAAAAYLAAVDLGPVYTPFVAAFAAVVVNAARKAFPELERKDFGDEPTKISAAVDESDAE